MPVGVSGRFLRSLRTRSRAMISSLAEQGRQRAGWCARPPHQRHCGTGMWLARDIAAGWYKILTPCASLPTRSPIQPRTPAREAGIFRPTKDSASERRTLCWRETDSNHRSRGDSDDGFRLNSPARLFSGRPTARVVDMDDFALHEPRGLSTAVRYSLIATSEVDAALSTPGCDRVPGGATARLRLAALNRAGASTARIWEGC